jgi:hypothetical protein
LLASTTESKRWLGFLIMKSWARFTSGAFLLGLI